ncbi:hypothetical protein HMPREF2826_03995 [Olsenella sp. HMSC062G07]|nr:hypothetical protein HMPREF2826_03995 [Olsenella sp. HMSC062G07]
MPPVGVWHRFSAQSRGIAFIIRFLAIFAVYVAVSGGLTLGATMNVFRHGAVIGIIAGTRESSV